jgi:YD repeat-containing protein
MAHFAPRLGQHGNMIAGKLAMLVTVLVPQQSIASSSYIYDAAGRMTMARYDNGSCLAYAYDANGNRTSVATLSTIPTAPTWGVGIWGCIQWAP